MSPPPTAPSRHLLPVAWAPSKHMPRRRSRWAKSSAPPIAPAPAPPPWNRSGPSLSAQLTLCRICSPLSLRPRFVRGAHTRGRKRRHNVELCGQPASQLGAARGRARREELAGGLFGRPRRELRFAPRCRLAINSSGASIVPAPLASSLRGTKHARGETSPPPGVPGTSDG